MECIMSDFRHTVGDMNGNYICTTFESPIPNTCHTVWDIDIPYRFSAGESTFLNLCHAIKDIDILLHDILELAEDRVGEIVLLCAFGNKQCAFIYIYTLKCFLINYNFIYTFSS